MEKKDMVNVYVCEKCGNRMVTKNKEEGTTPFLISCDVDSCDGHAKSSMYRVPQNLEPDYFWVKLSDEEMMERAKEHAEKAKVEAPEWYNSVKSQLDKDPAELLFEQSKEHADAGGLFKVKNEEKKPIIFKSPPIDETEYFNKQVELMKNKAAEQNTFSELMEEWVPKKDIEQGLVSELELELLQDFVTFLDNTFLPPSKKPWLKS
jgi:hypothetical protein